MDKLREVQRAIGQLKLDDSLLFLNHVLSVSRGDASDAELQPLISGAHSPVLPHTIHFLAKQLLLHASNFGTRVLAWGEFQELVSLCVGLDDPIQHDPDWTHADPSGFFERVLAQQIAPQNRNVIQKYGLALGLFRDVGVVGWPKTFDLSSAIEAELGTTVEQFMAMGLITMALRSANVGGKHCAGSFTPLLFAHAFSQGFECCVPEVWTPFLKRVACNREEFCRIANDGHYAVEDDLHQQFGLNPLKRFPVTDLGQSRYLATDPELIVERVTSGLFYDLFERDRTKFSNRFGYAFDQFVGQLLKTICPSDRLWSAADWEQSVRSSKRQSPKIGDWAYIGRNSTILFECKSMRPNVELTTYGTDDSIDKVAHRVASAAKQLIGHATSINCGEWSDSGLHERQMFGVVVTYGKFFTVNSPFTRKRVRKLLIEQHLTPIPFVVLSINELDSVIRLVELGHELDSVIASCATDEDSFDPLYKFRDDLRECAVSSTTFAKGDQFMEEMTPT